MTFWPAPSRVVFLVTVKVSGKASDPPQLKLMVPPWFNPNGVPNRESLLYCYRLFRDRGVVTEAVPESVFATLWASDLVDEVLQDLGRLPES